MNTNMSMDDYNMQKGLNQNKDPVKIESEQSDMNEIEFHETVDNIIHYFMGQKKDVTGHWKRDPFMKRLINKQGASLIQSCMATILNKNMNFAKISETERKDIIFHDCSVLGNNLYSQAEEFEIPQPHRRYTDTIAYHIWGSLRMLTSMSENGHMSEYRATKTKTIINKVEQPQPQGGAY